MKFRIYSSEYCVSKEIDKLFEKYPILEKYGFTVTYESSIRWKVVNITDEYGKRMIQKTPYDHPVKKAYITIDTLDQLMDLIKTIEYPVIITEDEIEIYDGYRE